MKHPISLPLIALLGLCSLSHAQLNLNFLSNASHSSTVSTASDSMTFTLNTATLTDSNSDANASIDALVTLTGTATSDATALTLEMQAGWAFDSTVATWDTTASASSNQVTLRQTEGWAPHGSVGTKFNNGEILFFEVGGLAANQRVVITDFGLTNNNSNRLDFYFGAATPTDRILLNSLTPTVADGTASYDVSGTTISLANGENFGFGWRSGGGGRRTGLREITFDVITVPEPGIYALLVGLAGLSLVVVRRRP